MKGKGMNQGYDTPPEPATKEDAIRLLIGISGIKKMVVDQMTTIASSLKGCFDGLPDEIFDDYITVEDAAEVVELLFPVFDKHYSFDDLKQIIEWNQSPVGQKTLEAQSLIHQECLAIGQVWGEKLGERFYKRAKQIMDEKESPALPATE